MRVQTWDVSGRTIADRVQENMVAYYRLFAGLPGIAVADGDVVWLVDAGSGPGNQVLRTQVATDGVEGRIDEILADIGHHTDHIDWLVFPGCRPADLGKRLEARGMASSSGGLWMLADLGGLAASPPTQAHLRIERVSDVEMLAVWARASSAGFGSDTQIYYEAYARHGFGPDASSIHYVGYLHDEPVTSSTLLLEGGIAGLWDISTPPLFRSRGFASAITVAMMHEARRRGYQHAWVWPSAMGRGVYTRAGFVAADLGVREYCWRKQ